ETDKSKEYRCYPTHYPSDTIRCKRRPVLWFYKENTTDDHRQDNPDLDQHHDITCFSGFLDPDINQPSHQEGDQSGGHIKDYGDIQDPWSRIISLQGNLIDLLHIFYPDLQEFLMSVKCITRRHGHPFGEMDAEAFQHGNKVLRPRNGNHHIGNGIFEHQGPAYNPCKQFTKCHISIGICTTGNRHGTRKLSIGKSSKHTGKSHKHEEQRYGRTTIVAGQTDGTENTSPYDGCNTKGN